MVLFTILDLFSYMFTALRGGCSLNLNVLVFTAAGLIVWFYMGYSVNLPLDV